MPPRGQSRRTDGEWLHRHSPKALLVLITFVFKTRFYFLKLLSYPFFFILMPEPFSKPVALSA